MRRTLSMVVNDQPGVLSRIAGLFTRRGYNIESLTVGTAEQPGLSRMTISTTGDEAELEQIIKQVEKLIDVISVVSIGEDALVARELMLIKVSASAPARSEINGIVEPFRASIVDVAHSSLIIQATGDTDKNDALVELLRPYGIIEIARTGVTALIRGQLVSA
ncbi:MAG: acetolactate synthase, small subunit [Bacilli bacterium]|nr:acetolactate synthase, small subunit [Bacilli bacterium]